MKLPVPWIALTVASTTILFFSRDGSNLGANFSLLFMTNNAIVNDQSVKFCEI